MSSLAQVTLIKTIDKVWDGEQVRWDETANYNTIDAWIIEVSVIGDFPWGPIKYRRDSKKEHSGISTIKLTKFELNRKENAAEEKSIAIASYLEEKGFNCELFFKENTRSHCLESVALWFTDIPPYNLINKMFPMISDILPSGKTISDTPIKRTCQEWFYSKIII